MKTARLARDLMLRSQGHCEICNKSIQDCAHAHRLIRGGKYVLENTINLCFDCHMLKIHSKGMKIKESQLGEEQINYIVMERSREYKYIGWGK